MLALANKDSFWEDALDTYLHDLTKSNDYFSYTTLEYTHREVKLRLNQLRFALSDTKAAAVTLSKEDLSLLCDDDANAKRIFPLLAVVLHTQSEKLTIGLASNEITHTGPIELGNEIKLLITNRENQQRLRKYLKNNHLRHKVFVCTKEEFISYKSPAGLFKDQPKVKKTAQTNQDTNKRLKLRNT
jgi:hypothetical protein